MKKILFIMTLVFASCHTVHKVTTESKKTSDSTINVVKDTNSITKQDVTTDKFTAKTVDIKINYSPDSLKKTDTVVWSPFYYKPNKPGVNKINDLIGDAIANSSQTGRIPSSIEIHLTDVGDSTVNSKKSDSTNGHTITKEDVKKTDIEKTKDVKRTGLSFGIYVIVVIIILAGLLFGAYKLKIKLP